MLEVTVKMFDRLYCLFPYMGSDPRLIRGSPGSRELATQTTSRSVQSFWQGHARDQQIYDTIRYDTIRDAILTCARKPT